MMRSEECVKMDPYQMAVFTKNPYRAKVPLHGKLVVVLDGQVPDRGLELIRQPSRAVCKGQVHELIVTEQSAYPGDIVNSIVYLGFVEFENGGVLVTGDKLIIGGQEIGHVCGFDETHMPNHINIVIHGLAVSSYDRKLSTGQAVLFIKGELGSIHAHS
jgi:hypothetical protein